MSDSETQRRKRQSEALRENLKRRKSQLRGRAAPEAAAHASGRDGADPQAADPAPETRPIKTP